MSSQARLFCGPGRGCDRQDMTAAPSPSWLSERTGSLKEAGTSGSLCPVPCTPGEAWGGEMPTTLAPGDKRPRPLLVQK